MFKEDEGNLFILRPEGVMAILPVGEDHLFRIMGHETNLQNGDSPNIDKTFIDASVEKRCGINIDIKKLHGPVPSRPPMGCQMHTIMVWVSLLQEMLLMFILLLVAKA